MASKSNLLQHVELYNLTVTPHSGISKTFRCEVFIQHSYLQTQPR